MWPQELPGRTGAPPVLSLPVARCSLTSSNDFAPASQKSFASAVLGALHLAGRWAG